MNDTKLLELKAKIQDLITENDQTYKKVIKTRWDFLYKKLAEINELETLQRLEKQDGWNSRYLQAFLLYKSICRANFQTEHLKLTKLENTDKCLEMIEGDIEANFKDKEPKKISNQKLLILLSERIHKGEIIRKYTNGLVVEDKNGEEILLCKIDTGALEPDPAEEFLKKHGIKPKK